MGFNTGERVVVTSPDGSTEFIGVVCNRNDFREMNMAYAVYLDEFADIFFFGEKQLKKFEGDK